MQTGEDGEMSILEEVRMRAEKMKERRMSANKVVRLLWNRDIINENKKDKGDAKEMKTRKELELTEKAKKFDKKRRISGNWLGKCKPEENVIN